MSIFSSFSTYCVIFGVVICSNVIHQTKGCIFGSSERCAYKCNCENNSVCNATTGECPGKCMEGLPRPKGNESLFDWRGSGCRIGNIAYAKNASVGTIYQTFGPYLLVDGRLPPQNGDLENCAAAVESPNVFAWLQIDLYEVYVIQNITIFNRRSVTSAPRTGYFNIRIGNASSISENELCTFYKGPVPTGGSDTVECDTQLSGRFLSFQRTGGQQPYIINICEVVVMGYKKVLANCDNCVSSCDDIIGCTACDGFVAPLCKKRCNSGFYGINCATSCAAHNCKNGSHSCHHKSGECPEGCQEWYLGEKCDKFVGERDMRSTNIQAVSKDSTTITVSWLGSDEIEADLVEYYGYQVQYKLRHECEFVNAINVSHTHGINIYNADVTDLAPNTEYEVRISMYRHLRQLFDGNTTASQTVQISTPCGKPIVSSQASLVQNTSGQVLILGWKVLLSGCSSILSTEIWHRVNTKNKEWTVDYIGEELNRNEASLKVPTEGILEAKVRITNDAKLYFETNLSTVEGSCSRKCTDEGGASVAVLAGSVAAGIAVITAGLVILVFAIRKRKLTRSPESNSLEMQRKKLQNEQQSKLPEEVIMGSHVRKSDMVESYEGLSSVAQKDDRLYAQINSPGSSDGGLNITASDSVNCEADYANLQ